MDPLGVVLLAPRSCASSSRSSSSERGAARCGSRCSRWALYCSPYGCLHGAATAETRKPLVFARPVPIRSTRRRPGRPHLLRRVRRAVFHPNAIPPARLGYPRRSPALLRALAIGGALVSAAGSREHCAAAGLRGLQARHHARRAGRVWVAVGAHPGQDVAEWTRCRSWSPTSVARSDLAQPDPHAVPGARRARRRRRRRAANRTAIGSAAASRSPGACSTTDWRRCTGLHIGVPLGLLDVAVCVAAALALVLADYSRASLDLASPRHSQRRGYRVHAPPDCRSSLATTRSTSGTASFRRSS